jgi:enterochelin esterase-like enzyme
MEEVEEGWELKTLPLEGGTYGYKFLADGEWFRDPHNALSCDDGYGGKNSLLFLGQERGSVHHFTFHSHSLNADRWYIIYLPPFYFLEEQRLNTLYLFHGVLDWEWTWLEKAAINRMLDLLIREKLVGNMIVVMPRENGELFRGDHRYGSYLGEDLTGHIDSEFLTMAERGHRAVDGLSTGGYNALYLGGLSFDSFCSAGAMSGAFNDLSYELILENREALKKLKMRFILSCGQQDPGRDKTRAMARFLGQQGLSVEHYENPGPHEWDYWGPHYPESIQFHWNSFQGT